MHNEVIKDIGEKELIERVAEYMPANQASDDCALIKNKKLFSSVNWQIIVKVFAY